VIELALHLHFLTLEAIKSKLSMPAVKLLLLLTLALELLLLKVLLAQELLPILAPELLLESGLQHTKTLSTTTLKTLRSPRLNLSALLKCLILTLCRKTRYFTLAKRYLLRHLTLLARYIHRLV
jgi:hypothetical protein